MVSLGLVRARSRLAAVGAAVALVATSLAVPASAAPATPPGPLATKALFFAADGMRPDRVDAYAAAGDMPTMKSLMDRGVKGVNGMQPGFPPNTGVGWYTMMTGTWPSEHGSTNNTYHRTGESSFNNRTSFSALQNGQPTIQADTLAAAAERAGKKVAQIDWVGGVQSRIAGPTVDFTNFFSTRGVLASPLNATEQAGASAFGISYQVAAIAPASGWTNAPAGDDNVAPPQEAVLTVATTFGAQNPTRLYDLYIYDSIDDDLAAYDTVQLVRSGLAKNLAAPAADLAVGDFEEIKLTGADGLIGARAGQTAGFYTKLISLAPDLSSLKLYFTSVQRVIATCSTAACNALSSMGGTGLENYLADNFPTYIAGDFAPLEARVIDEDTYVEQGNDLHDAYADAVTTFILGTLQPNTDVAFVGFPTTDEIQHQFLALTVPTDMDGNPNPYYDDLEGNGTPDGLLAQREGYIRGAYADADRALAQARSLMGGNPTTVVGADHGFAPQWYAVNAGRVLSLNTVDGIAIQSPEQTSNCRAATTTNLAKACWAGGTAQIYVNTTLPAGTTYEEVRAGVVAAFEDLTDPANPAAQVVQDVMLKEELRNVQGVDSLHPSRSGDVVVVLRPPYQFDAATPGQTIAFSQFFGQHGYLPDLVDVADSVNMHATFIAGGPGIRKQAPVEGIRQIDVAPTIAYMLGIPGPQNARGKILTALTTRPSVKVYTTLNISDFHAQLTPLTDVADNLASPGVNNAYAIGGSAFLKSWFDWYRAEATNGSLTLTGGDSFGGATPPISNFFGDLPGVEALNLMGVNAEALGNHQFDRGEQYLRNTLLPLADFDVVSSNVVFPNGNTPSEWAKSAVYSLDGAKVGVIGFTTEATPDLIFPGQLGPFEVRPIIAAINAEAARLRAKGVKTIIALGHEGATGGTVFNPTGPLAAIADGVVGVDVVMGDHNDLQVNGVRPNGVLVTENRGKGLRFTRVTLVVDPSTKSVVYKTADYHRPWNLGVTPDAALQAQINDLTAQLGPILNVVVGYATKPIPRADQCGGGTGRLCESLVGNVGADAMISTFPNIDFAIHNAGSLRADLTCPTTDQPSDFCPPEVYPVLDGSGRYPITRGQVLGVLPFGNTIVKVTITGVELKTMLENGVSQMPSANGRFPQVAGLCFTYDIAAAAGSRVTSVVRANADGTCTATPVSLTAGDSYDIVLPDFLAGGGDGYPVFTGRTTSGQLMDQAVADWIGANSPINPVVRAFPNGRINCADTNGVTAPNCPPLVPSP